jgi:adenine-specific DNA-methyltransferase
MKSPDTCRVVTTTHSTSASLSTARLVFDEGLGAGPDHGHLAVSGDNLEALKALEASGDLASGTVDVVYIDPPYNTGNTAFDRYEDDFGLDETESWSEFIRPRLFAAKRFLNRTGVIMVSIGDDEHHRCRLMLDEVFGEKNFISNIIWSGGSHGDARYVSSSVDYILVYARDAAALKASGVKWRERKPWVDEVLVKASDLWAASGQNELATTLALKAWQSGLPKDHPYRSAAAADYNKVDEGGAVYRYGSLAKPAPGKYLYDVIHPSTGLPVNRHRNGWRMPEEKMLELIGSTDVVFSEDGTQVRAKLRLADTATQVPSNVFESRRGKGAAHLKVLLGDGRFPYPKDHEVLMRWIGLACPNDGTVLDFFGGSGSTMEAVLRLNATDEGTRRCVLVTNNEIATADGDRLYGEGIGPGDQEWEALGVFEHVTLPRLRSLVTGVRPDGEPHKAAVLGTVRVARLED